MKIEIGNPGAGTTVVIELPDDPAVELIPEKVTKALDVLKSAGDTWVDWSRDHETPEQAEMRELMKQNVALKRRALVQQNAELEAMLSGKEGVGPLGDRQV